MSRFLGVTSAAIARALAFTPLSLPDGTGPAPALAFSADSTMGLYRRSAGALDVSISGVGRVEFTATSIKSRSDVVYAWTSGNTSVGADTGLSRISAGVVGVGTGSAGATDGQLNAARLAVTDGVTAPGATVGVAKIYVDSADGDLKVVFGDGQVKTLATDTP